MAVLVDAAFDRRREPLLGLARDVDELALTGRDMAGRFARGGRLLVFGNGTRTADAQHVAVEFVHPVITGRRALPALSLAADAATVLGVAAVRGLDEIYAHPLAVLGRPDDIALGLGDEGSVRSALRRARQHGMLTVALVDEAAEPPPVDHVLRTASVEPLVVKEAQVTTYHLLWELVHVFLDAVAPPAEAGGALDLYPFLGGRAPEPSEVLAAAAASARQKVEEVLEVRRAFGATHSASVARCAEDLAARFRSGGTLLALGNGGSSTDAQDVVHAFLDPPAGCRALPALCLTNDVAVVTALSNDVGFDVVFARQVRAFGKPGDAVLALSTSGGSRNVLQALEEARALGMLTIGLAGYGGGPMATCGWVDHMLSVDSSSVHRVQEVQTTVTHVLWEQVTALLAASPRPRQPVPG